MESRAEIRCCAHWRAKAPRECAAKQLCRENSTRRSGNPWPSLPLFLQGGEDAKKTLKREEEPEEYWQSKIERSGKSPLSDPAAIIGILAIFFPFVILGIAIATGYVDVSAGRV